MAKVKEFGYARSGDKGAHSNVGVVAYNEADYKVLKEKLSAEAVQEFFAPLGATKTIRYELDNLQALNFVIYDVLGEGGALSLRSDAQGKGFGQYLLELEL